MFCLPGLGRLDDCGALIVADVLKRKGINARVSGAATAIENDEASSICICYLENVSKGRMDYAIRRLSRQAPSARIVVCLLTDAEQGAPRIAIGSTAFSLVKGHNRRVGASQRQSGRYGAELVKRTANGNDKSGIE